MKISDHIGFFERERLGTNLTVQWDVCSQNDRQNVIGVVKWYGPWRKYCFFPRFETVFDVDCLFTIAGFCERETTKHREAKRADSH